MQMKVMLRNATESDAEKMGTMVVDTCRETYSDIFLQDFFEGFTYEKQISKSHSILAGCSGANSPAIAVVTETNEPIGYFAGANTSPMFLKILLYIQ
jgi:hypothetical protein